jgi:hypothetical protein
MKIQVEIDERRLQAAIIDVVDKSLKSEYHQRGVVYDEIQKQIHEAIRMVDFAPLIKSSIEVQSKPVIDGIVREMIKKAARNIAKQEADRGTLFET